jgi:hypothetical protein
MEKIEEGLHVRDHGASSPRSELDVESEGEELEKFEEKDQGELPKGGFVFFQQGVDHVEKGILEIFSGFDQE